MKCLLIVAAFVATAASLWAQSHSQSDSRKLGERRTTPFAEVRNDHLDEDVSFPASGIRLRRPKGFAKADSFDGFINPENQSSILAVTMAVAYSELAAGFTRDQLKARGWSLQSREEIKVDESPALLVHFEQPVGGNVFSKWSLIFGDTRKSAIVTAAFLKLHEGELSPRMKSAVLSARFDRAAPANAGADELPFTLVASQKLKLTPVISRMLAYTKDGAIPNKSPSDPLFVAAPALAKVVPGDKRQFAEQRLRQTAQTKGLDVKSTDALAVAGLDGYESLAEAQDAKSGVPIIVYQLILFDGESLF